jgi:hypothetical protein
VGIPFLLVASGISLSLVLNTMRTWTLCFALLTLLYIAEAVIFRKHSRSEHSVGYLREISFLIASIPFFNLMFNNDSIGYILLLSVLLLIFSASECRKKINCLAIPHLIMLFFTLRCAVLEMPLYISSEPMQLSMQIISYILILLLLAGMGRLLLPSGFCNTTDGRIQIDWALLIAVFPIFSLSSTIDWYPSILACLFLSIYSLMYIGRVKSLRIPLFMASLFACLTLFYHNVYDPFGILEIWKTCDMKAPQILLYLLPMHIFIFCQLWIFPHKFRSLVHGARFSMYCFTMLCLLLASLGFNHVSDAIVLAIFSFAILLGSFFVKKLRWFTLGFSVLFLITFKMTWNFWRSLHWGIYLFLAGALLISIAFYFEYTARKVSEQSDAPKRKLNLFKTWTW